MRILMIMAIATMSMWITSEANAQQKNAQSENGSSQRQVDGEKSKGKRGQGRRGDHRKGAQGKQGQNQQQGKRGARRDGTQILDGLFKRFDKDANGSISLDEAPDRMKQRFDALDADGDKAVSKDELRAAFAKMGRGRNGNDGGGKGKAAGSKMGKGKDGGKKGKGKNNQSQTIDPAQLIQRMDKNNDGVISLEEAPEKMKQRFDRMDADSSGTISAEEIKKAYEMRKKGGKNGQVGRDKSANPEATKPVKPKRPPTAGDGT